VWRRASSSTRSCPSLTRSCLLSVRRWPPRVSRVRKLQAITGLWDPAIITTMPPRWAQCPITEIAALAWFRPRGRAREIMLEHNRSLETFKDELTTKKQELRRRIEQRRNEIMVDRDPDDEGAHAVDRASRDFAALNIEREMRTLAEIESSLHRLARGQYGVCAGCSAEIPVARLEALPWTRLCVDCAGGGVREDSGPSQPVSAAVLRRSSLARSAGAGRR